MDKRKIDVSIILLTYNQENYVVKALESIVSQQFVGEMEVIIADDHSSDYTFDKIKSFLNNQSEDFFLYSNGENIGLAKNYEKAILQAKGKYIAYLEGDDYWTDNLKIQKQFDFLEINPDCVLAFHDFITIDDKDVIISRSNLEKKNLRKNRSKKEMITGCLIHQNTIMFRNVIRVFPIGFFNSRNHDTFLIAYLSNWGIAGFVECEPLHYRILNNSLWSSLSIRQKHLNGLVTFLWVLTIVKPVYYFAVFVKILSKAKSFLFV